MSTNAATTHEGSDELTGLYTADTKPGTSVYPPSVERVYVAPAVEGYHDIVCFDADGSVVARQNRSTHRVRAAIEHDRGDGFSMIVQEAGDGS